MEAASQQSWSSVGAAWELLEGCVRAGCCCVSVGGAVQRQCEGSVRMAWE